MNAVNDAGNAPLHTNIMANAGSEFLQLLIEMGASLESRNNDGKTPLQLAIQVQSFQAIASLMQSSPNISLDDCDKAALLQTDNEGNTVLHKMASSEEFGYCLEHLVNLLQENNVAIDLNIQNNAGNTMLHCAIRNNVASAISFLIRNKNVSLDIQNKKNKTSMDLMIDQLSIEPVLEVVQSRGKHCVNDEIKRQLCTMEDDDGNSLLHKAVLDDSTEAVLFCLEIGLDINRAIDKQHLSAFHLGGTPLHLACEAGVTNMARVLIEHGADINSQKDFHENTPAHVAARNGHLECLQVLVAKGADFKLKNGLGHTVLDCAQMSDSDECAEFVMEKQQNQYRS